MSAKRLIILGDGSAGTIMANMARRWTRRSELDITVIGNSLLHYYKPDGIFIATGLMEPTIAVKNEEFLLNYGINYVKDTVVKVNPENRSVLTEKSGEFTYDYLVIATGDRYTPEDLPGYDDRVAHYYDLKHAMSLRDTLMKFKKGRIVVGRSMEPIQCPPSPIEISLLLDHLYRSMGIRKDIEITYLYTGPGVFSIETLSKMVEGMFREKNIDYIENFNIESIDHTNNTLIGYDGSKVKFDLLILVPPHRGQAFLTESGLADEFGYVDVDQQYLNYRNYDDLFVIGDATNLSLTKAGSVGHLQAKYLSRRIADEIHGCYSDERYDGFVECIIETGFGKAVTLYYSHQKPPRVNFVSSTDHFLKYGSTETYFGSMLRGMV
ncbi:NAD(P)/FAD-dependent oxidoreductase [Thermoplasma sp.]|uniref:NAD(P)/FAD-dependent oxidoreductase n=1 Tax=Thermoplasma sp. TaxID=1973142 RepID=UPI001274617F|nr:FAD/NAD(P)-binding oxidoreductase [Thermoplasma sp.]KAA8921971.1 MAG: NAD(P)/FAD-dependent oxidoreductase [Thermoplasma sp.]